MSGAGNVGLAGGLKAGDGWLKLAALAGVVVITAMTGFGVDGLPDLLIAVAISALPYVVTYALAGRAAVPARVRRAFAVGLLIYLALDAQTRYVAFFAPTSSTAAIAVVLVMIFSVLIIPAGAALAYLALRLFGPGGGAAFK